MLKLRTEIDTASNGLKITHADKLLFIGSCFSDEIGRCLTERGFDTSVNPFGPLYNPLSILNCIERSLDEQFYTIEDLTQGPRGYHCLDYATRFSGEDSNKILNDINSRLSTLKERIEQGAVVFITLGTSYIYEWAASGAVVGNCHKFPASLFKRRRIGVDECSQAICRIRDILNNHKAGAVVFTVSPIRHLADGFHENTLSKSTLHLGIDTAGVSYFPSYEILMDDLRDYRAYADDLVHVSDIAVKYVYEKFEDRYFNSATKQKAALSYKTYRSSLHRQIL